MKKILKLGSKFSKVAGFKISIQKSVVFQNTTNYLKRKSGKISLTMTLKRIRYLEINDVKDSCTGN